MDTLKYLGGVSIVGLILIFGLSANVSAMPYISIGDTTHNFTVVPGQDAEITLPILINNASDASVKGLQFNVTYNNSQIEILNITETPIVDSSAIKIYNETCNGSSNTLGDLIFCFYINTTLTANKTNASVLFASVKNISNNGIIRIAFASYKNLTGSQVEIGKIKMKVKPMSNYFNTSYTSPLNITVEKMGANHTVNVNVSNVNIQSQVKINGLIKACRGDANGNGKVGEEDVGDVVLLARYGLGASSSKFYNLTNISECLDINGNGIVGEEDVGDVVLLARYGLGASSSKFYNISTY